jgi:hypothetical protein
LARVLVEPNRSSKGRPRDQNKLAAQIVSEARGESPPEEEPEPDDGKDPAAAALGRKGGLKGGKGRAERMMPEERRDAAKRAAEARWRKK